MTAGASGPSATLGERVRIRTGRRRSAVVCVEHCVRLDGRGVFVSGWVLDPRAALRSVRLEIPGHDLAHPAAIELPRPEIVAAHRRELGRAGWRARDTLRPGFWETVAVSDDRATEGLRLVCELPAGGQRALTLPVSAEVAAILSFVQASGLYSLAPHLPADSGSLPRSWRDALLRLSWLVATGSVEAAQLEAYLERHEPLSQTALAVSFESSRPDALVPPPDTVRALRASGLFDERHYRAAYPEVAASGADLLMHYLTLGHREGRDPSTSFNTTYYRARYLAGDPKVNPLVDFYEAGAPADLHTHPGPHDLERDVYAQVRKWTATGELAEDFDPSIAADRPRRAKVFAFYLPQFHTIPENDGWWGPGFTEWRNVLRGMPRFAGHYQPRIPRDLGFYDLTDHEVMRRQAALAGAAGLHGFCFYYYRFNGKRVLERPIDRFLTDDSIDLPFCLIWANENWTRRWDGAEDQILLRQEYDPRDDEGLVDDLQRHFADPRYLRLDGRPLLLIYRLDIIPAPRRTLDRWREIWRSRHAEEPLIFLAQTFDALDPREYGTDGAVEFPPHKLARHLPPINQMVRTLDPGFTGHVYEYETLAASGEREPYPEFPLVKGVMPSWDNDARRAGTGVVVRGSTPARYQRWLRSAIEVAGRHPVLGERLVFVNAWNEWAEGAYLEPDVHFGAAYLNATARAVCGA